MGGFLSSIDSLQSFPLCLFKTVMTLLDIFSFAVLILYAKMFVSGFYFENILSQCIIFFRYVALW